ncbi:MAG: DUF4328 domain-containing protein [Myxococcota bacterium]
MDEPWTAPGTLGEPQGGAFRIATLGVLALVGFAAAGRTLGYVAWLSSASPATIRVVAAGWMSMALLGTPVWVYWHWRAASNLVGRGVVLSSSPAIHAFGWFIPLVNLVVPFRATRELVRASTGIESRAEIGLWWATSVIGAVLGAVSTRVGHDAMRVILSIQVPFSITANCLYLWIVWTVWRAQTTR